MESVVGLDWNPQKIAPEGYLGDRGWSPLERPAFEEGQRVDFGIVYRMKGNDFPIRWSDGFVNSHLRFPDEANP